MASGFRAARCTRAKRAAPRHPALGTPRSGPPGTLRVNSPAPATLFSTGGSRCPRYQTNSVSAPRGSPNRPTLFSELAIAFLISLDDDGFFEKLERLSGPQPAL